MKSGDKDLMPVSEPRFYYRAENLVIYCRLSIFHFDDYIAVLATQRDWSNPSITNTIEDLAKEVTERYKLHPASLRLIEHYEPYGGSDKEKFALVHFRWAGNTPNDPKWTSLTKEQVQRMIGWPLPKPSRMDDTLSLNPEDEKYNGPIVSPAIEQEHIYPGPILLNVFRNLRSMFGPLVKYGGPLYAGDYERGDHKGPFWVDETSKWLWIPNSMGTLKQYDASLADEQLAITVPVFHVTSNLLRSARGMFTAFLDHLDRIKDETSFVSDLEKYLTDQVALVTDAIALGKRTIK